MKTYKVKVFIGDRVVYKDAEITVDERDDTSSGDALSWNGHFNDHSISLAKGLVYHVELDDGRSGIIRIKSSRASGTQFVSIGPLARKMPT